MVAEYAIVVRNAVKRYGTQTVVLNGLNMTVRKGSIYALLGASGCGKTTLLSCVVGVQKLDSGDMWVLGGHPGTKRSGVPGPRVGYMPQDIALCDEFSVTDALYYFGRINNLEDSVIEERHAFFEDLFQLPPRNRLVKNMSGGQQRRLSFAAALIHMPELLILDEPTVGLDPVLRENIWNFLTKIAEEEGITVVITTHYIEEAREAHMIGLLRGGTLLAESPPTDLLQRYQTDSLEEAFLTLSQMQVEGQEFANAPCPEFNIADATAQNRHADRKYEKNSPHHTVKKMNALIIKNILQFVRYPGGCLFAIVLPLIQTLIFFYVIGGDPKGLQIYVVNDEAGNCNNGRNWGNITFNEQDFTCNFVDLSCRFLRDYGDSIAEQVFYDDVQEAKMLLKKTRATGVMYFSRNFSQALQTRLGSVITATEKDVIAGAIQIWLDMGDREIGLITKKKLVERFFEIFEDVVKECRISPKFADVPIRFEDPIFGTRHPRYSTFMAPGFLLTVVFFLATAVCGGIIISDRYGGVWDRSLVQGVKTPEILLAHFLTQMIIITTQVSAVLAIAFGYFGLECKGSFIVAVFIVYLQGVCGMGYGLLISIICTSHTVANYITTGSFYPAVLLCGCIWPLEGMPKFLQYISMLIPTTLPGVSLRNLIEKGYSMDDPNIYNGFLVVTTWIVCLFGLSFYNLRRKTI